MRAFFLLPAFLGLIGCGGNVVVDGSATSTGGAGGGTTTSTTTGTTPPSCGTCPSSVPPAGAACACVGQACSYDDCDVDGPLTAATCDPSGTWAIQSDPMCTGGVTCGTELCAPGFVCVHVQGLGETTKCVLDPCAGSPLSCACAASACSPGAASTCAVMGSDVYCACNTCV